MPPDILRAEELARGLLLRQRTPRVPVPVRQLKLDPPIIIDSMQRFCRLTNTGLRELSAGTDALRDGCTFIRSQGGKTLYLVLYNEDIKNRRRRSFTLAHELGHILLGHQADGETEELEANRFAAELLIPRVLALACLQPVGESAAAHTLADVFGTSLQVAQGRLRTLRGGDAFTEQEDRLLRTYLAALPSPDEPVVGY